MQRKSFVLAQIRDLLVWQISREYMGRARLDACLHTITYELVNLLVRP